jgi:hypothetical protein
MSQGKGCRTGETTAIINLRKTSQKRNFHTISDIAEIVASMKRVATSSVFKILMD